MGLVSSSPGVRMASIVDEGQAPSEPGEARGTAAASGRAPAQPPGAWVMRASRPPRGGEPAAYLLFDWLRPGAGAVQSWDAGLGSRAGGRARWLTHATIAVVPFELTGISLPWFGVSWKRRQGDKDIARQVLNYLEDRRVLHYYRSRDLEEALHCLGSAMKIREYLTTQIDAAQQGGILVQTLMAMRAAARRFVEQGGPNGANWQPSARQQRSDGVDLFSAALGEFRSTMGMHIAALALAFELPVPDSLVPIMPPVPAADD
jgi:hypothetical protein